jgi:hypothetical protein
MPERWLRPASLTIPLRKGIVIPKVVDELPDDRPPRVASRSSIHRADLGHARRRAVSFAAAARCSTIAGGERDRPFMDRRRPSAAIFIPAALVVFVCLAALVVVPLITIQRAEEVRKLNERQVDPARILVNKVNFELSQQVLVQRNWWNWVARRTSLNYVEEGEAVFPPATLGQSSGTSFSPSRHSATGFSG